MQVKVHPSLALIKYWGKQNKEENTPATSSLAISLDALSTTTSVCLSTKEDEIYIQGIKEKINPKFFDKIRDILGKNLFFSIKSTNNFPTSAGLASSSSGFAAIAFACLRLVDPSISLEDISSLARFGSASAARAIFGGFTVLKKGEQIATPLFPKDHWKTLRIIIAIIQSKKKDISSRDAMNLASTTSPFYEKWKELSDPLFHEACFACETKNLSLLGPLLQKSYLAMFSTMFTSYPPVFYWEPETISILKECEHLRKNGCQIFETMDAGPQVKMILEEKDLSLVLEHFRKKFPQITFLSSTVGGGIQVV